MWSKKPHQNRILSELLKRTGKHVDSWIKVKNKIDTLKGTYKEWVDLMGKTSVSSNQRTGVICMDDDWWQAREAESKTIIACHRQPLKYWDALQRICGQYDVSSEHMYDVDGARRELYEEYARADFSGGIGDDDDEEDERADNTPQTHEENTYFPDNTFIDPRETYEDVPSAATEERYGDILVASSEEIHNRSGRHTSRAAPYSVGRGESSLRRRNSRVRSVGSKDRGNRRRHQFESSVTTVFQGISDARRATVSALRPDRYSPEEYAKFKDAFAILNSLPIEKYKPFWKASAKLLKEYAWWRNTFLDTSFESDEDIIQFLESITEVDRLETVTPANLSNFGSFLSGSSGGSVPSSGSSVGHSSENFVGYSSGNSEYRFAEIPQFQPSPAMGQFFSSLGVGFNTPGHTMGAPYVPMMFPQGFAGFPFMNSSPAIQMMQTSTSPEIFNVGASSTIGGISTTLMGETSQRTRTNFSPGFVTPTKRYTDTGYRFGAPSGIGTQPWQLNFMDDRTSNNPTDNKKH
ncbi:PREDICTED: uncharacterized protein LOC109124885 [Camelina sativa]|uniref:Uncharacterized protein LOC109124885 n=1 Tax=Camelina sativa TaxID=90675 RepID=A0ABM1R0W0_CAMSA|nr:PREDICTED: uncharacterized protein LOC109124885 [Camelina sativa]